MWGFIGTKNVVKILDYKYFTKNSVVGDCMNWVVWFSDNVVNTIIQKHEHFQDCDSNWDHSKFKYFEFRQCTHNRRAPFIVNADFQSMLYSIHDTISIQTLKY